MTSVAAAIHAKTLFGEQATVWADTLGHFKFVKANADPKLIGDLTIPFGCGLTWEDAFANVTPQVAGKG